MAYDKCTAYKIYMAYMAYMEYGIAVRHSLIQMVGFIVSAHVCQNLKPHVQRVTIYVMSI